MHEARGSRTERAADPPVRKARGLVLAMVLAAAAGLGASRAAGDPLFVREPRRPLLAGRERVPESVDPEDPPRLSHADEFPAAFGTDLIDIATTDMVDRRDPVLGVFYVKRGFDQRLFSNVAGASHEGVLVALAVRPGRDFQLTLEAPFYNEKLALLDGFRPRIPGSVSAGTLEVKYLVPYEVLGWRTAIGGRTSTLKDVSHPLFTPGDWTRLNRLHVVFSRALRRWMRLTFQIGHTNIPQPAGLVFNDLWSFSLGTEAILYRKGDDHVRWITEVDVYEFDTRDYNHYGNLAGGADVAVHAGLRIKTGIVEIEAVGRRIDTPGFREARVGFRKKF